MMKKVVTVKCTSIFAQVNLGFYDEAGNLVGEETFPQVNGNVVAAHLFHPHPEQLSSLIDHCVQQAWEKIQAPMSAMAVLEIQPLLAQAAPEGHGSNGELLLTPSPVP
jgi:hypothetical protein